MKKRTLSLITATAFAIGYSCAYIPGIFKPSLVGKWEKISENSNAPDTLFFYKDKRVKQIEKNPAWERLKKIKGKSLEKDITKAMGNYKPEFIYEYTYEFDPEEEPKELFFKNCDTERIEYSMIVEFKSRNELHIRDKGYSKRDNVAYEKQPFYETWIDKLTD